MIVKVPGLHAPFGITIDNQNRVYVSNSQGDTVVRFPADDPSKVETFKIGIGGPGVALDSKGNLWAASLGSAMKFRVIYQQPSPNEQNPIRVVEQTTGREVGWINRYLDREYVRRLAITSLRIAAYNHNLLHFVRWWESIHHTGDIVPADLSQSTLLDYVRFQFSQ